MTPEQLAVLTDVQRGHLQMLIDSALWWHAHQAPSWPDRAHRGFTILARNAHRSGLATEVDDVPPEDALAP